LCLCYDSLFKDYDFRFRVNFNSKFDYVLIFEEMSFRNINNKLLRYKINLNGWYVFYVSSYPYLTKNIINGKRL